MAVPPLPGSNFLGPTVEERTLADLPSESDAATAGQAGANAGVPESAVTGPTARVFWRDVASSMPQPPAQPPAIPRLKRSLIDSPFAGAASKRPFRRRDVSDIPEEAVPPREEEPSTLAAPSEDDITTDNLQRRLPSVPSIVTTSTYMQVSINPVIWRSTEAPGGLMMNVGLSGVQLEGQHDLQLYLWSTMNPRIITTGIPQPTTGDGTEDGAEEAEDSSRTRHGRSYSGSYDPRPPKRDKGNLILEEVFLVRKDPQRRIPDEVFHTSGPFEGGTVLCMPDWPGDIWSFDICCRVSDGSDTPIWLKILDRRLQ